MLVPYKQTPPFTEADIPAGLLRDHRTRAGVWARIVVTSGRLKVTTSAGDTVLEPGSTCVMEPQQRHSVAPQGEVRFHVEFCRMEEP